MLIESSIIHECRFVLIFLSLLALTINFVHSGKVDVVLGRSVRDHVAEVEYAREYEDAIKANAKLKDFEIIRLLGGGGYGKVYLVRYKLSQEQFAMKEIITPLEKKNKHGVLNCDWELFDKELRTMRSTESPYIVMLHFYFFANKPKKCAMYLVMQPFKAGDLFKMIMTTGALMHRDYALRFIAANMVLAVEYLHKRKVTHRDIKVENFLIGDDGYVALSDFGLSVLLKESCTSREQCGSPNYVAPEVMLNKPYNHVVDWWSLGVTLYAIATCTDLFDGSTFDELIENILYQPIVMPDSMPPNLKGFLLALITREPTKRLGAKKGAEEVKNHPFFEGADWSQLENKSIPAPIVPRFDADGKLERYYDTFTSESFWISPPVHSQVQQPQQQHNPINGSQALPNPWA